MIKKCCTFFKEGGGGGGGGGQKSFLNRYLSIQKFKNRCYIIGDLGPPGLSSSHVVISLYIYIYLKDHVKCFGHTVLYIDLCTMYSVQCTVYMSSFKKHLPGYLILILNFMN